MKLADLPHEHAEALSGAAPTSNGKFLVVAPDEGSTLCALGESGEAVAIPLKREDDKDDVDIDFEGVARHGDGDTFFAIGSHSSATLTGLTGGKTVQPRVG